MLKKPIVERGLTGGLTTESALDFCNYLAEEADWNGHADKARFFRDTANNLQRQINQGIRGEIHAPRIEEYVNVSNSNDNSGKEYVNVSN